MKVLDHVHYLLRRKSRWQLLPAPPCSSCGPLGVESTSDPWPRPPAGIAGCRWWVSGPVWWRPAPAVDPGWSSRSDAGQPPGGALALCREEKIQHFAIFPWSKNVPSSVKNENWGHSGKALGVANKQVCRNSTSLYIMHNYWKWVCSKETLLPANFSASSSSMSESDSDMTAVMYGGDKPVIYTQYIHRAIVTHTMELSGQWRLKSVTSLHYQWPPLYSYS